MEFIQLTEDRFLRKDPNQSDQTKDAVYTAGNPAPKRGDDSLRKQGRPKGSEEDDGAPNILTGTVIVSCFIQTSALPSRIELQGNDITFFDDTFEQNGQVIGDTSRLIFTHGSAKSGEIITQGFILEKRASIYNTYDNVLSWYALPPVRGAHNFFFLGRNGGYDEKRNLHALYLAVRKDSATPTNLPSSLNGVFAVEYSEDEILKYATQRPLLGGSSEGLFGVQPGVAGYSAAMTAGDEGALYWLYKNPVNPQQWITIMAADNTQLSITVPVTATFTSITLAGGITWTSGTGSPEGVVTAPVGSLYSNVSGGASTTLYVKTSGTGNTGWTAK